MAIPIRFHAISRDFYELGSILNIHKVISMRSFDDYGIYRHGDSSLPNGFCLRICLNMLSVFLLSQKNLKKLLTNGFLDNIIGAMSNFATAGVSPAAE